MTSGSNTPALPFIRAAMIGAIHLSDAVQGVRGGVGVHQIHEDVDAEAWA